MEASNPEFNVPPKKFHPYGLEIIHEDRDVLVVNKINGLLTIGTDREREKTAHFLLNNYVQKGNHRSKNRVFIVHRLDRETSGLLIFAKSESVKCYLQDNWKDFDKTYYAVVNGNLKEKSGIITSYLRENNAHRVYSVAENQNGKYSQTEYKVLRESKTNCLIYVRLITGRKHQIRVHFKELGHPVVGDKMYGIADGHVKRLALHAATLSIVHPHSKRKMKFETEIPGYFHSLISKSK